MSEKKILKSDGSVAWSFYIRGYLDSAILNIEDIIFFIKKYPKRKITGIKDSGTVFSSNQNAYLALKKNLWIPTIFLIRHSIELILKSISINLYSEFLKDHDISNLLDGIKKIDRKKRFLNEDMLSFSKLCRKYFLYEFFSKSIVSQPSYLDKENLLFRYPESYYGRDNLLVRIDDFTFFNNINVIEAKKFLQDAKRLKELASILEVTPSIIESHEKIGVSAKETKHRIREIRRERKERQKNTRYY